MKQGYLSNYFKGIAAKRLSAGEVDSQISNQHEFNGVNTLKNLFGTERKTLNSKFVFAGKDSEHNLETECVLTWYDSRENVPTRAPEFRLYYSANAPVEHAKEGDLLIIAQTEKNEFIVFITEAGSTTEAQLIWMFGLNNLSEKYQIKNFEDEPVIELDFSLINILDDLGVEIEESADEYLEQMIREFGNSFPSTRKFSEFARNSLGEIDYRENPDILIMQFFEREELLFRTFEKHIVREKLVSGFGDDVDKFISYSLSVQNRRKSRAGYALENQLEHIFTQLNIKFSRGQETENKSKPDFLFPGIDEYRNNEFSATRLSMLGVKSTCKDRWRQVLSEAARIERKHLFTLEPAISMNQTNEMEANYLSLVLPESLHSTYKEVQRENLLNLSAFIDMVKVRESTTT